MLASAVVSILSVDDDANTSMVLHVHVLVLVERSQEGEEGLVMYGGFIIV